MRGQLFGATGAHQSHRRHHTACHHQHRGHAGGGHPHAMPPYEFLQAVARTRGTRDDRFVGQMPTDISRQPVGRFVAMRPIGVHGLHDNPIEIASQFLLEMPRIGTTPLGDALAHGRRRGEPDARCGRAGVATCETSQKLVQSDFRRVDGQVPHEQLVEHDAERIDVGTSIHVHRRTVRLLRAHVGHGAHGKTGHGFRHDIGPLWPQRLRNAKVDDLRLRMSFFVGDENVGRLEVAVNHALLVCVLYRFADADEELQTIAHVEPARVAELRERQTTHELHGKVRLPGVAASGMQHARNAGVIHHRQCAPFRVEARQYITRFVEHGAHQFQRDPTPDRCRFFGFVHHPHAAFTKQLDDFVGADARGMAWQGAHVYVLLNDISSR